MASEAARAIEAILMVAQEPVDPHLLAQLLEVPPARVSELCDELQVSYAADDRGFVLVKVAGGYRFQSHGDLAPYVERFVLEGQHARLSAAALETLAIVAYKQPISRAQVAAIRGVNVDGVMRTLQQRGYIDEVGRDPGPGQATMFGTTREFLERMGLDSLSDLPPIAALLPSADVLEALERGLRAEPEPRADQPPSDQPSSDQPATTPPDTSIAPSAGQPGDVVTGEAGPTPSSHTEMPPTSANEPELPAWFTEADSASPAGDHGDPQASDHAPDDPGSPDPQPPLGS